MLQWGRDRAVAELATAAPGPVVVKVLQWGRDRAVAELSQAQPQQAISSRFNGAATARSRNYAFRKTGTRRQLLLQWGRDRAVAELS